MTLAAIFFLKKSKPKGKETFGFKSTLEPQRIPEMKEFENKMLDMVENVEFRDTKHHISEFQRKIGKNIGTIKSDQNIYVKADKTTNYHKMSKATYKQYMSENIQKNYKQCAEVCER